MRRFAGYVVLMLVLLSTGAAFAEEPAAGKSMSLMSMGDKVFSGKIGDWTAEARLINMREHMKRLAKSGRNADELPILTHHLEIVVTDPKTGKPLGEGTGTLTITGPDKKSDKTELVSKGGQFGVDLVMVSAGKYVFKLEIVSGKQKGVVSFGYKIKKV